MWYNKPDKINKRRMSVSLLSGSQFVSIKQYLPSNRALKQMYGVLWLLCFQATLHG
jgi:hypothetical protein